MYYHNILEVTILILYYSEGFVLWDRHFLVLICLSRITGIVKNSQVIAKPQIPQGA